jgi:hypothetical protein
MALSGLFTLVGLSPLWVGVELLLPLRSLMRPLSSLPLSGPVPGERMLARLMGGGTFTWLFLPAAGTLLGEHTNSSGSLSSPSSSSSRE